MLDISDIYSGVSAECLTISLHYSARFYRISSLMSRRLSRFTTAVSVKELPNSFFRCWQIFFICPRSVWTNSLSRLRSLRCVYIFSG